MLAATSSDGGKEVNVRVKGQSILNTMPLVMAAVRANHEGCRLSRSDGQNRCADLSHARGDPWHPHR